VKLEARGYANQVQVKTSKSGKTYTQFGLGVKQKEKAWGDKPESVTWANFNVTDFGGTDVPDKSFVTVSGYLKVREYVKDGTKRQALDLVAESVDVAPPLDGTTSPATTPKPTKSADAGKEPWDD
jgi:hypothetical protein